MKGSLMKKEILLSSLALFAGALLAAESSPKDEVTNAAKKLAATTNYSWKATVTVPEDAPFRPGPTEGKTEKDGFTSISLSFFDNTTKAVLKGDKGAISGPEGGWQSLSELEKAEGPGQFTAIMVRNIKTPAVEAAELAAAAKELKKDGDVFASDLTEAGAKAQLTFKMPGGEGPTVSNAKGSVKFWIKDGVLTKYEFKVKGTVDFGGNNFDNDRTTTVEIKDVGTTKVDAPDEAKKKLS
jgi:hypothetical protein